MFCCREKGGGKGENEGIECEIGIKRGKGEGEQNQNKREAVIEKPSVARPRLRDYNNRADQLTQSTSALNPSLISSPETHP